jgi:NADH-quinone oxidoreductase subunit J
MLEAHFLATAQIIVYAGAVMVLVVFVLMLLNVKTEARQTNTILFLSTSGIAAIAFLWIALPVFAKVFTHFDSKSSEVVGTVAGVGTLLYTKYLFAFELASVLIVAAIVGAVMLAKRKGGQIGSN